MIQLKNKASSPQSTASLRALCVLVIANIDTLTAVFRAFLAFDVTLANVIVQTGLRKAISC